MAPRFEPPALVPLEEDPDPVTAASVAEPHEKGRRLPRESKKVAYINAKWKGAAPTGKHGPPEKDENTAQSNSRKRAASGAKESTKTKSQKAGHASSTAAADQDIIMSEAPVAARRATVRRRQIVDSDPEEEERDFKTATRPQPKPRYKNRAPVFESAGESFDTPTVDDAAFAEDTEMAATGSDDTEEAQDGDEEEAEDDDLQGADEVVSRKLADATPIWHDDEDEDSEPERYPARRRSSSRASASSGHLSVPASEFEDDDDAESDEESPALQALQKAHERVPATAAAPLPVKEKLPAPSKAPRIDLGSREEARGRNQAPRRAEQLQIRRAQEVPTFNPERSISRTSESCKPAKQVPAVATALGSWAPPESDTSTKSTQGRAAQRAADADCIDIVLDASGKPGKKAQHPRVSHVFATALEYFFILHLIRHGFPDTQMRIEFAHTALTHAAAKVLKYIDIAERLEADSTYRDHLAHMLNRRISAWRGKLKIYALEALYSHYRVQHGCADRVAALLAQQTFIYAHRADTVDPANPQAITFGKPIYGEPFMHPCIMHVAGHFFRGKPPSIGARLKPLLPRNSAGNIEAPRPLLAMACSAIYSALGDWSTGEFRKTDFDSTALVDNYKTHLTVMDALIQKKPEKYRLTMETIFSTASQNVILADDMAKSRMEQDALDALDLSD
ncbi:hypothetical protein GGX14DRAFT_564444 [Mycena pura]|uniref:DUF6532 domain-containing protein n=1 Tax=Mycena pura TaxID=153505 RepID=A0AAD6VH08_9AGAR|nr:hypothetical protein GGX14DRAFT_564444 [Mycena pura]